MVLRWCQELRPHCRFETSVEMEGARGVLQHKIRQDRTETWRDGIERRPERSGAGARLTAILTACSCSGGDDGMEWTEAKAGGGGDREAPPSFLQLPCAKRVVEPSKQAGTRATRNRQPPIRKPGSNWPIGASKSFRQGPSPATNCFNSHVAVSFPGDSVSLCRAHHGPRAGGLQPGSQELLQGELLLEAGDPRAPASFGFVVPVCFHSFQIVVVGPSPQAH